MRPDTVTYETDRFLTVNTTEYLILCNGTVRGSIKVDRGYTLSHGIGNIKTYLGPNVKKK